ncbi:MAG: metal-binding protein [Rhodobacter sp.]|nr:metal-binding protein [Rhodobacter sp.]
MTRQYLGRRDVLLAGVGLAGLAAVPVLAASGPTTVHVRKDPDCGCCTAWIEILAADGFAVTVELMPPDELLQFKLAQGIPETMVSCHTAEAGGYLIEGHVPPADLRRLLADKPDALGLAVPGMPWGSPGMGPEAEREAYDVFLVARDGSTTVFARYPAA